MWYHWLIKPRANQTTSVFLKLLCDWSIHQITWKVFKLRFRCWARINQWRRSRTMLTYTKTNLCVTVSARNFCDRYDATCGSSISKWDACDSGSGTGKANTQACRIYHLELAQESTEKANIHCPHAIKAGTGFCDAGTANIVILLVDRNGVMLLENKWLGMMLRSLTQKQTYYVLQFPRITFALVMTPLAAAV